MASSSWETPLIRTKIEPSSEDALMPHPEGWRKILVHLIVAGFIIVNMSHLVLFQRMEPSLPIDGPAEVLDKLLSTQLLYRACRLRRKVLSDL